MAKHSIAKFYKAFLAAREENDHAGLDAAAAQMHVHPDEEAFLLTVDRGGDISTKAWPPKALHEPKAEPESPKVCPVCGGPR